MTGTLALHDTHTDNDGRAWIYQPVTDTWWSPDRGQELPDLDVIRTEYGDQEVPS